MNFLMRKKAAALVDFEFISEILVGSFRASFFSSAADSMDGGLSTKIRAHSTERRRKIGTSEKQPEPRDSGIEMRNTVEIVKQIG